MIFKKISHQIFFVTSVPLVFIIAVVSILFFMESLSNAEESEKQKGNYIARQAVLLSEFYFYTGNNLEINNVASLIIQDDDVVMVKFTNALGEDVANINTSDSDDFEVYSLEVVNQGLSTDAFDEGFGVADIGQEVLLGVVSIGLSNKNSASRKQNIYGQIIVFILMSLMAGMLLTYVFSRKLLSGLTALKDAASSLQKNNLNYRCKENGSGELLTIQKVFNDMAESVQDNELTLSKKVADATQSLEKTVEALSAKNIELDQTRKKAIELERSKAIIDERSRIMKDMHDGIGGQLIASLALIENEKDSDIKLTVTDTLKQCVDDLRLIINSLSSSANTLSALLADFKYRMGRRLESLEIDLIWRMDDELEGVHLQPQQGLNVLRILQEAFTNIIKHSQASKIRLNAFFDEENKNILIMVEDDGHFVMPEVSQGEGLKNMRWRAAQISAELDVGQSVEGGCTILLSLPVSIFVID